MGMPEIPDGKNRPTIENTIIDLLESIALEEMAISHVLNAEGEKLQAIIAKYECCDINLAQMTKASKSVNKMIVDLIMKEWLLLVKFNYIDDFMIEHYDKFDEGDIQKGLKQKKKTRPKRCYDCDEKFGNTSCKERAWYDEDNC